MKRFIGYFIGIFLVSLVISVLISYKDARPVDGPLTIGYPSEFFFKSSGFLDPVEIAISWTSLLFDILIIGGISLILTYFAEKIIRFKKSGS